MPKITPELQEAYNEWLLRWGYREVTIAELHMDKPMLNNSAKTYYKDWQRCVVYNEDKRVFRLRTIEAIEIYDENNK